MSTNKSKYDMDFSVAHNNQTPILGYTTVGSDFFSDQALTLTLTLIVNLESIRGEE